MARQKRTHDSRAIRQRRRVGEPMGVLHVRALMPFRAAGRVVVAVIALAMASAAFAHEIGTTQVTAEFRRDHTYVINVVTGSSSLLSKLQHHPIRPIADPVAMARPQARARALAEHAAIRFGSLRCPP